jgi:hypothetical protein
MFRTALISVLLIAFGLAAGCGPGEANPPEGLVWTIAGEKGVTEVKVNHLFLKSDCPNAMAQVELKILGGTGLDWTANWPHIDDAFGEQWALNKTEGVLDKEGAELLVPYYRCQPEESGAETLWLTFSQSGSEVGTVAVDFDVKVVE